MEEESDKRVILVKLIKGGGDVVGLPRSQKESKGDKENRVLVKWVGPRGKRKSKREKKENRKRVKKREDKKEEEGKARKRKEKKSYYFVFSVYFLFFSVVILYTFR